MKLNEKYCIIFLAKNAEKYQKLTDLLLAAGLN